MANKLTQYALDGYTGRMNPRTGIVEFGPPPAVRRRFAADGDLKEQVAALKRQIQSVTRRAEVAESELSRIKLAAPAVVSPATTPADVFAILGERVYSERRQMQMSAPRPPSGFYNQREGKGSPAGRHDHVSDWRMRWPTARATKKLLGG